MLGLRKTACSAVESVAFANTILLIVVTDSALILEVFLPSLLIHVILIGPILSLDSGIHILPKQNTVLHGFFFFPFTGIIRKYLHLLQQIFET